MQVGVGAGAGARWWRRDVSSWSLELGAWRIELVGQEFSGYVMA